MSIVYDHELNSPLWLRLTAHWEGRLRLLREQNDSPMDEHKRNIQVGRIAEMKAMLELGREKPTATKFDRDGFDVTA